MTKQTEALKLALEALKGCEDVTADVLKAITALREALASEAIEQPSGVATIAQKQEPVAWMNAKRDMTYLHGPYNADDIPLYTSPPSLSLAQHQCKFPLCQNEEYQQALAEHIKQELYTGEPAQRKPLTLGQKQRLWSSVGDKPTLKDRVNAYGTAIEAAHGIKEKNT